MAGRMKGFLRIPFIVSSSVILPYTFFNCSASPVFAETEHPIVVVGGGVAGSSTAYHLSERGEHVVLVDAAHSVRGSWGESRNVPITQASDLMLQTVRRGITLWKALENQTDIQILYRCGGSFNFAEPEVIDEIVHSFKKFDVPYKFLNTQAEVDKIAPGMNHIGVQCIWNANAYVGKPEKAIQALKQQVATHENAEIIEDYVEEIDRRNKTVTLRNGQVIQYSKLVLATGVWTNQMMNKASLSHLPIFVSYEQTVNFNCLPGYEDYYAAENFPLGWGSTGTEDIYWAPRTKGGISGLKVGWHKGGEILDNDEFIFPKEFLNAKWSSHCFPDAEAQLNHKQINQKNEFYVENYLVVAKSVQKLFKYLDVHNIEVFMRCLYALVPDDEFLVGQHPEDDNIYVACGFSGEGFKHSIVVGEFMADLLLDTESWSCHDEMKQKWDPHRYFLNN